MINPTYKLSAYLLLILSASVSAESYDDYYADLNPTSGFYVGLDLAASVTGEVTAEYEGDFEDFSDDIDVSSAAFSIGYRTESNNRVQLSRSATSIDYDLGESDDVTGTELDFHYVYGEDLVQPYIGFGLGYYTLEDSGDYIEDGSDLTGVSFQLLGGIKLDVHKNFEFDISYHVKSLVWEEIMYVDGPDVETTQITHNYQYLNLGAAFKF
jgi:opacity protein-like surface antigen